MIHHVVHIKDEILANEFGFFYHSDEIAN